MSITREQFFEYVDNLTVLDLSKLIKEMEERYGVSAAPTMVAAGPVAAGGGEAAVVEEQTEFNVVLTGYGDKKINVLKVVREITNLGLKEAKDLVEGVPKPVKEGVSKAEAEDIKKKLEEAGGTVEIK